MTNINGHRPLRTRLVGAAGPWHAAAMERSREMPAPGRFEGGDTSRTRWTHEETLALLSILKQMNVGGAMDARNQRNTPFFLRVMELLRQRGIACWTLTQVRVRWKNLKARYLMARRARERGGGGGGGIGGGGARDRGKGAFAYFKEINEIIGGRPCVAITREGDGAGVAGDRHVEPDERRCYEFREEDHVEPNFKQEAMESKSRSPPYFAEVEVSGFTDHMDMAQGVKEEVEADVESYSPQCNFEGDTAGTACIVPRGWTSNVDVTGESAAPSTSLGGAAPPPRPCSGGGSSSDGSGAGDLPARQRAYLGAQERMLLRLQRSSQEASFAFQRELQADEMRLLEPHLQAAAGVAASFLGVMERLSSLLEATVRDLPFVNSAGTAAAAAGNDRTPSSPSPTPQTPGQAPPTSNQSRGEQTAPPRSPPHHRRHHHRHRHQGLLADADVDGPVPSLGPHGRAANGARSHGDETATETPMAASPVAGTAAAAARRDARTPLLATSSPPRRLGYGGHKLPARFRTAEK